jgi:ankyrin repeat protein
MICCVLDAGADVNSRNDEGSTPLDIAREHRLDAIVELLERGNPTDSSPTIPTTGFWYARLPNNAAVTACLLHL